MSRTDTLKLIGDLSHVIGKEIAQTRRDVRRCRANVESNGGAGCDDVADAELDCTERHLASLQRILEAIDGAQ